MGCVNKKSRDVGRITGLDPQSPSLSIDGVIIVSGGTQVSRGKKKKTPRARKTQPQQQSKQKAKLSSLLNQADGCLPTALAVKPINEDIIFVEAGHFLDRKMRTRLAIASAALQGIENGSHLFGDDVPLNTQIAYNELSDLILDQLDERNIPVRAERPFLFDYRVLAPYLPRRVRVNEFYNAFVELMLNEWKTNYARKLFVGFGFKEHGMQLTPEYLKILDKFAASSDHKRVPPTLTLKTARGLWFASECIIRIRSQWDKLIDQLVFRAYFPENPTRHFDSTIEKLEKYQDSEYIQTEYQKQCLTALVKLARCAGRLTQWRDNDVHQFSETVFGVLEKPKTNQSLDTLWDMVVEEHNRVREAVVAMIGMVVLTSHKLSKPMICIGKWPPPTHYIDFESPEDMAKHSELIQAIEKKNALQTVIVKDDLPTGKAALITKTIAALYSDIYKLIYELYQCKDSSDGDTDNV